MHVKENVSYGLLFQSMTVSGIKLRKCELWTKCCCFFLLFLVCNVKGMY